MSVSKLSESRRDPAAGLAAVLVLYKCNIADSHSFRTFMRAVQVAGIEVPLLIYDNSPLPQLTDVSQMPGVTYHHDSSNGGLVAAYNFASKGCESSGVKWLLLLDQDTALPETYLQVFLQTVPLAQPECVAFVPRVRINGRVSSPKRFILTRPRLSVSSTFSGPVREEIVAINSGMFVNVEHLRCSGGYPAHYHLDAVDFWFCASAYAAGKYMHVLDSTVDHSLSIRDMSSVSIERWESITGSDANFIIAMRSRTSRLIAALEGVAYAGFLLAKGYPEHARIRLRQSGRVAQSVWGLRDRG